MTWLAFSCSWLRLSPPMGLGFSRGLGFWPGAVGHRAGPVVVMSSRSKSWSLARFSFCKASYSTSGWFHIWRKGGQQWKHFIKVTITGFTERNLCRNTPSVTITVVGINWSFYQIKWLFLKASSEVVLRLLMDVLVAFRPHAALTLQQTQKALSGLRLSQPVFPASLKRFMNSV